MQQVVRCVASLGRFVGRLGPYLMLEILMPGGTLLALLLFVHQRRNPGPGRRRSWAAEAAKFMIESVRAAARGGSKSLLSANLRSEP